MGLRMCMTIIPIVVLLIGLVVFKKNYILTDEELEEITLQLEKSHRT
jgi:melibiose permease